jgi:glycosyltransferase involved in cell wall biosynthesis
MLVELVHALRGFNLIHLHYPFFGGELTMLASKLFRIPMVITYHNDVLLTGPMGLVEKTMRSTVGRVTLRSAARLLFSSQDYSEASYVRQMLRGRRQTVAELHNGVDTSRFTPAPAGLDLRLRHGLEPGSLVALLVAALDRAHYFKGVYLFLKALSYLPEPITAVIVGDGDMRRAYMTEARELGVERRVVFAGRVSDGELADYYRMADLTVLPSVTMGEAFGLVLVESMASGTPVVASDLPGVRTVVSHGRDGLLTPPGDARELARSLEQLLSLPQEVRRSMGHAGRLKVEEQYSWRLIGDKLERTYLSVMKEAAFRW